MRLTTKIHYDIVHSIQIEYKSKGDDEDGGAALFPESRRLVKADKQTSSKAHHFRAGTPKGICTSL